MNQGHDPASRPLTLLFGVHAHQPFGNFDHVIEDALARCYRPFLQTLHRYPGFRFTAHFSGWLLDRLAEIAPDDLALLEEMVRRGQVELFGAGDYEPVLAALPARDRERQLLALSNKLALRFGERPTGAWLTERVWEPGVVPALATTGIRYVTVDDYHFLCTGLEESELDGFFTTEEEGVRVDLFPISEALRYRLPFAPVEDTIVWLESRAAAGREVDIYFDDIEKFGIWPETFAWVYEAGWLARFIEAVLASPWLRTATYRDFHASHRSHGLAYLPTVSYSEMNAWTLPPTAAARYAQLVEAVPERGSRPFVRGGIWRNFLSRYPEANWMHKRMLGLSARLAASPRAEDPVLRKLLHAAQANDAYWHGLFGGLYLPHLRRAVWRSLLKLEAALDAGTLHRHVGRQDIDCDGVDEFIIAAGELQCVLRDDGQGAVHEFSSYLLWHNFADTLRRHPEHYHRQAAQPAAGPSLAHGGIASAHERAVLKVPLAGAELTCDPVGRLLGQDQLLAPDGSHTPLREWRVVQLGPAVIAFEHALPRGLPPLAKRWSVTADGLVLTFAGDAPAGFGLATQCHVAMPAADGFGGRYRREDGHIAGGFGNPLALPAAHGLVLEDAVLGGRLELATDRPAAWRAAPWQTVSQSEAGLEKIMQGIALEIRVTGWAMSLRFACAVCPSWL